MVPDGWLQESLERIASKKIVYGIVQAGDHFHDGIPYIKSTDVGNGIDTTRLSRTHPDIHNKYRRSAVVPGDLVISLRGNTGAVSVVPAHLTEANLTQGTARIAVSPSHSADYVRYQISSDGVRRSISRVAKGSTFTEISLEELRKVVLLLPPLPEQQKIANILSTWDKAIETTEKLLANAKAQQRALMQKLLRNERRLKRFSTREWKRVPFDTVFERVRRKNSDKSQKILTISGKEGLISQAKYFSKNVSASDTSGYTLLQGEEFAYNKSYSSGYPLGAIKMLPMGETGALSSLYICFRIANEDRDCPDFYRHWFEFGGLNRELSVIAQEGARNHGLLNVGMSEFFKLLISRPDVDEQRQIANVLNDAERQVHITAHQLQRLELEKRALMQQLLTGKRRVKV